MVGDEGLAAYSTKKLVLVTKGERNLEFLTSQLKDLIGDKVIVDGICVDTPFLPIRLDCDLVVLSSSSLKEQILPYVNRKERILVAYRAINSAYVDKLLRIPAKTRAMVVNTSQETSQEVISQLYGLGFHELWLIPVYPGMENVPQVDMAITPDEESLVPSGISEVVNIVRTSYGIFFVASPIISRALITANCVLRSSVNSLNVQLRTNSSAASIAS
jgi:hypothetical protein